MTWNRLFPEADVRRWEAEYRAQQLKERQEEVSRRIRAHERPAPKEFVYRPRPESDWDARAIQCEPEEKPAFVYQVRSPELWAERAAQQIQTHRRWEMSPHGHWKLTAEGRRQLAEKVQAMLAHAREFQATITVKELAATSGRSEGWVRRHLKNNGITLEPQRRKGGKP